MLSDLFCVKRSVDLTKVCVVLYQIRMVPRFIFLHDLKLVRNTPADAFKSTCSLLFSCILGALHTPHRLDSGKAVCKQTLNQALGIVSR